MPRAEIFSRMGSTSRLMKSSVGFGGTGVVWGPAARRGVVAVVDAGAPEPVRGFQVGNLGSWRFPEKMRSASQPAAMPPRCAAWATLSKGMMVP